MTQPSRRTPPTSSQANLSATASRGRVDNNPKSASKTGAKKPAGKAGRPQAKDNTKLYIGIGVGGGLLLLFIIIACCSGGSAGKAVQKAASGPAKVYNPLESYNKMSVTQRMNVYREGLSIDEKVSAEMAKIPMTGDRTKDMNRHSVETGIQGKLESALMLKYKLNRQSYDKINSDGVNGKWE